MTDCYAVMGNPIHHSLSPRIHTQFAKQTGEQLIYQPIEVPLNGLAQAVDEFQKRGGKGFNITLPFKEEAFRLVDIASERAKRAKAVNTIRFEKDGSRFGDNTDGAGFVKDFVINQSIKIKSQRLLVLGAGGAVRGILAPLLDNQPEVVVIANRTLEKAEQLSIEFAELGNVIPCSWDELSTKGSFDAVIHGTSLGFNPESIHLPASLLSKDTFCYDLSYNKTALTPFLQWAAAMSVQRYCGGLGMLVEQAAEAFYLWRNVKPLTYSVLEALNNYYSA